MTENRVNNGVRNLRAMFESQNAASSPEPRGRSPARKTDADRPTPKVKASFVPVEPRSPLLLSQPLSFPLPLGAAKGTPDGLNSPVARRRESFSVSAELGADTVDALKKVVSDERESREESADVAEAVPESAIETRESSRAAPAIRPAADGAMPNLGSIMKGSDFPEPRRAAAPQASSPATTASGASSPAMATPEPTTDSESIDAKLSALSLADAPADPTDEAAMSGGAAPPPPTEVLPSTPDAVAAPAASKASHATPTKASHATPTKASHATPTKAKANGAARTPRATGASPAKKPAPISIAKASAANAASSKSPLPRSPAVARLPRTPITPRAAPTSSVARSATPVKDQTKAAMARASSLRPSVRPTSAGAAAKAKAPVLENKKPAAHVPRTTAAHAPKAATTHAPKTSAAHPPKATPATSPVGFKKPRPKSPTRPVRLPSHLTAPTAASAAKHGDEVASQKLARKPSTTSRPATSKAAPPARKAISHSSLPPVTATGKRPESRTSAVGGADEGFMARMMRPTASSQSKTHDKPSSPPRRGASVRALTKPRVGHESAVAKGKRKVGEVISKAKETVTNDHGEDHDAENTESVASHGSAVEGADEEAHAAQPEPEAASGEQADATAEQEHVPSVEGEAVA